MEDLGTQLDKVEKNEYVSKVFGTLDKWYDGFAKFTPNLIVGIIVFLFFLLFSSFLTKITIKLLKKYLPKKADTVTSFVGAIRFVILLIGTFISLEIMGLSGFLWKFIGSLGVAGVVAGVALKDLVSSIFSGMLIGIDKAFKVGDYITIGTYSGNVQEIGFLTTKIITDDGRKVYIPNQTIFSGPFFNVSDSPQRRIIFDFDIPADANVVKAKEVLLAKLDAIDQVDSQRKPVILITNLKGGNFTLQVQFWLKVGESITQAKSDALLTIKQTLDDENIKLVTPTSISLEGSSSISQD